MKILMMSKIDKENDIVAKKISNNNRKILVNKMMKIQGITR